MVALLSALRAAVRGTATVWVAGAAVLAASALAAVVAMGARHPASIARPSPPATTSRPTPPSPQLRRLTNNTPERNLDADASPDGKQLAFVDNGAVRVREIATGVERSISLPVGLHAVPGTVSFVDDRRVLFLADDAAQASRYYTAELGGAPAAPLPLRWESLSLSGDGAQAIATVTGDGGKGTETAALVDLTSGAERSLGALPPEASDLAPSPDASHIAWIHAKRLMVAAAAAPIVGHPVLEDPRLMLTGEGEALAWVDASSLLVVMRDAPNADSTNLWRVKLDSTGEASAGAAEKLTDWNDITITHVKVLGDRTVALRRSQTRYRAMVADVPPGTRHLVGLRALTKSGARERAGAWTGDGKSVLATSDATGRWGIYARPLDDTKEELPLRLDNVPQTWPELAADGRTLFYWAFVADGGMPPAQLMRSSLDGDPHAAAVPVLTSSDRTPWTGGKPMPKSSALRCPARASRCLLGDWNSAAGTVRWAWVDPASGGLEDLPLTTTVVGTFTWDVTPDGRQLWTARAPKPVTAPQTIQIFSLDAPGRPPEELRCDGAFNGFSIDRDGSGAWSGSTSSVRFCRRDGHQEDEWTWSDESWVGGLRASPDGRHVAFTQRTEVADVWLATDVIAERKP
jgi:hypothetical protein